MRSHLPAQKLHWVLDQIKRQDTKAQGRKKDRRKDYKHKEHTTGKLC